MGPAVLILFRSGGSLGSRSPSPRAGRRRWWCRLTLALLWAMPVALMTSELGSALP